MSSRRNGLLEGRSKKRSPMIRLIPCLRRPGAHRIGSVDSCGPGRATGHALQKSLGSAQVRYLSVARQSPKYGRAERPDHDKSDVNCSCASQADGRLDIVIAGMSQNRGTVAYTGWDRRKPRLSRHLSTRLLIASVRRRSMLPWSKEPAVNPMDLTRNPQLVRPLGCRGHQMLFGAQQGGLT